MSKQIIVLMAILICAAAFMAYAEDGGGRHHQNGHQGAESLNINISDWHAPDATTEDLNKIAIGYNPTSDDFTIEEYDSFENSRKEAVQMNDKIMKGDDDVTDDLSDEDDEHKGRGHERRVGGDDHQGKHKGWEKNGKAEGNDDDDDVDGHEKKGDDHKTGGDDNNAPTEGQSQANADLLNQIDSHLTNGAYYDNITADPMQW